MATSRLTEKPGGARDVLSWNLSLIRTMPAPGNPGQPRFALNLVVKFLTEEAAAEFDAKLRALLPEMKQ